MTRILTRRRCYNVLLILLMIASSRSTAGTDHMTATNSANGSSMSNDKYELSPDDESLQESVTNRMTPPSFIDHLVKVDDDEEDEEKNRSTMTTTASTIFANRNNDNVSDDVDFDISYIDNNNNKELDSSSNIESSNNIHPGMIFDKIQQPLLPIIDEGNSIITFMVNNEDQMDDLFDDDDDDDDDDEYTTDTSFSQRNLLSCVKSAAELKAAVKKAGSSATQIRVCTSRIPLGSLNRRRRQRRNLKKVWKQLAGGINLSNRSIIFTCELKERCILDGEGISRIFYGRNTTVSLKGFQFLNASSVKDDALGSGSALNFMGSSQVTIQDCGFHYNTAKIAGGAIMMNNSTLILRNSKRRGISFSKNQATYGGAIYGGNGATIQTEVLSTMGRRVLPEDQYTNIENRDLGSASTTSPTFVTFQDNYAKKDGGAVHFAGGTVQWNQVNLEENDATTGGALMLIDVQTTMTNVRVLRNRAVLSGGAIVFQEGIATMVNSTFISNDSNGTVGAITVISSTYDSLPVTSFDCKYKNSCWTDGSPCDDGTCTMCDIYGHCVVVETCPFCCNNYTAWYPPIYSLWITYPACGIQPCWDDETPCIVGFSCNVCCNGWLGADAYYTESKCGQDPCLADGRRCVAGSTCSACCNSYTYWYAKETTACGTEPCYPDGSQCETGTSCNACCDPATYWPTQASYACGTCWSNGTVCGGGGSPCNACCSGSSYWYSKGFTACGEESCWADGRICDVASTCLDCCHTQSYWDSISSTACGTCWSDGTVCDAYTTCAACCHPGSYYESKDAYACGSCWPDGTKCSKGTTCDLCCNDSSYWKRKRTRACGTE